MNGTVCTLVPGTPATCTSFGPSTPWWATETPLWVYLSAVALILAVSWSASWLKDHYEITGGRPVRRWYSTGAWVIFRRDACLNCPDRWQVAAWSDEATGIPWLLVTPADDEDADAFWASAGVFSPHSIRRFRPHLYRGWVPVLTARVLLEGETS